MLTLRSLGVSLLVLSLFFVACEDSPPPTGVNPDPENGVYIERPVINTVEAAASNDDADVLIVGAGHGDNSWMMLINDRGVEQSLSADLPRGAQAVIAHPNSGWYVAGGYDSQTEANGWIVRLAADLSVVWLQSVPTLSITGIAVHADEGPVVVAQTLNNAWDVAVLHFSEDGVYDWGVEYGTDSRDDPVDICSLPNGNFLFSAYLMTGDSFVGDSYFGILSDTGELLVGDITLPGDGEQHIAGLADLGDGSVAVAGYTAGIDGRLWLRLLSSTGIWLDEAQYGTSEDEDVSCVAALSSDRVITAGYFNGVIDNTVDVFVSDHDLAGVDRESDSIGVDYRDEYAVSVVRLTDTYGLVIGSARTPGEADINVMIWAVGEKEE